MGGASLQGDFESGVDNGRGESVTLLSGVLNNDTPDCDRRRGFLEARALVCGAADSNWCSFPPGPGLVPHQDLSGVGFYLCFLLR